MGFCMSLTAGRAPLERDREERNKEARAREKKGICECKLVDFSKSCFFGKKRGKKTLSFVMRQKGAKGFLGKLGMVCFVHLPRMCFFSKRKREHVAHVCVCVWFEIFSSNQFQTPRNRQWPLVGACSRATVCRCPGRATRTACRESPNNGSQSSRGTIGEGTPRADVRLSYKSSSTNDSDRLSLPCAENFSPVKKHPGGTSQSHVHSWQGTLPCFWLIFHFEGGIGSQRVSTQTKHPLLIRGSLHHLLGLFATPRPRSEAGPPTREPRY